MNDLINICVFFTTAGGSGLAASWLFGRLRCAWPLPHKAPESAVARLWYRALYAPRYARYTAIALAVCVASVASGLVQLVLGNDLNVVGTAMLAPVVGQLHHASLYLDSKTPRQ